MHPRIYIVEDEPLHLDHLLMVLEEAGHEALGHQGDAMAALAEIEALKPDIVLMDIDLGGRDSGITLAQQLLRNHPGLRLIFTTAQIDRPTIEKALSAVQATSYLIKPITPAALQAALILALKQQATESVQVEASHIFVRSGDKLKRINFTDITYLEADVKNYCTIHTLQKEKAAVRASLTELSEKLPDQLFVQVHRAYSVHFRYVESVNEKEQSLLVNGISIPIGKTFRKQVYRLLNLL